ncbi:hypothetical protein CAPTEDRAFT_142080, partial [Capitella teleta]
ECDVDNGGCQHQCNENDMDKWCSCDEGFQIASDDWRKCVGLYNILSVYISEQTSKDAKHNY